MPTPLADQFRRHLAASREAQQEMEATMLPALERAAGALIAAYRGGHKALFCGNGGSAADAQHFAAELTGRFLRERRPLPAIALHANSSALTAVANDYGWEEGFARELEALAAPGDVLVAITTSGNSANVIAALRRAKKLGLGSILLTGRSGGRAAAEAEIALRVPCDATPHIQECHLLIGHMLCDAVERAMSPSHA